MAFFRTGLVVILAAVVIPGWASAQCSTVDGDSNGVPDDCPAGSNYIAGSSGDDKLRGTNGADCIYGFDGDDEIDGRKGNDYICGGLGADKIKGGDGDNELYGEAGDDEIDGGRDDDLISGGAGDDVIDGKNGNDTIAGGDGADEIKGGDGVDQIDGGGGDDDIEGGKGDDVISGGDGADEIKGGDGVDQIDGDGGDDDIEGGKGDDVISGGDGDDILNGKQDDDVINGGPGNDTLIGENGNDSLSGEDGDDTLEGGGGNDALSGGSGNDTLDGGGGTNSCVEEVPGTSDGLTNCNAITYASVHRFNVEQDEEGLIATWETSAEVGTVAFRVWREAPEGTLAWVGEIAAAPDGRPHGASYYVRDRDAALDEPVSYLIEERTVSGGSVQYGPYLRYPERVPSAAKRLGSSGRSARAVVIQKLKAPAFVRRPESRMRKSMVSPSAVELLVESAGVVEVSAASISDALQVSIDSVSDRIRTGGLDLRLSGAAVAWHGVRDGAAIRFVAPEVQSPFINRHRYLLWPADGVTMTSGEHTPVASVEPHAFFATKRFEENVFPGPSGGPDPRLDLFFWHALSSNAQVSIPVSLPSIQDGDASELRVTVHGATEHPLQPHRVELLWNGQSLGTFDLFGRQRHTVLVPLQGATTLAENELVVQQHVTGADPPVLYVDAVEVDYTRLAEAGGPVFAFEQSFDGLQVVTGLVPGTAALYDVTTPSMPAHHDELEVDETGTTSFVAEGEGRRFVVASPDGIVAPSAVQPHFATDLRSETMSADYVIIAASHLVEAAEDLASYRRADGYRALVVDVEDVYWAFADGAPDPLAIRDFLKFASSNWDTAPRFAVLIGKGSLDYRDLLGVGGNWVSPALVATDGGLFPSDSMLGDFDAIDGVPEIPVGRLPITSSDELGPILDAIAAFEENHSTMDALFAADDSERGEFAAAATMLGAWADPSLRREIDLNGENLQEARARLSAMWEGPLAWLSYVGHGGLDRLADEGLLTQTDVPSLASQGSTPFILGWSCNINRFDIPGFFSLGEDLLTKSASVGVYSATGWSNHVDTDALRMALTEAVFDSDAETIGEAILRAHEAAPGEPASLHQVYTLLGDPALRLRAPKSEPGPEPEPEPMPNPDEPGGPGDARSNEPAPSAAGGCSAAPHGPTEGGMALLFALLCLVVGVRARAANATSRR